MRDLASKDKALPPKTGTKIEDIILRMAVKVALLSHHNRLTTKDFALCVRVIDDIAVDIVRK
jgi:hypothetical protein